MLPSMAVKYRVPLTLVKYLGCDPYSVKLSMSFTSTVPAVVPLLFQSYEPRVVVASKKKFERFAGTVRD